MKISYNWLKQYIEIDEPAEKVGQRLTDTGLEVEGIEKIEPIEGGLQGIVIGEVLTCKKHPNADKLKVTTVDIGEEQPSPIVCGAPNVATGQKVIVATVGATLYPMGHGSFKIKKAKIRGEVSQGMICAEDEIGIGVNHDGIMELDTDLANGTPAIEYFDFEDDYVFEIGLTPNRADAASHIGTARDLKAVLHKKVRWPSVDAFRVDSNDKPVEVIVENTEACPRYSGVTIANVTVKESPKWLQQRLLSIGLSPINNVVDITNFVLHETGQPSHAFDLDEIKQNKVIVKTLPEGSTFITLDEKKRVLKSTDLMICNGESEGMCIAGVFGGIGSGVKESTKDVFLECAYFSADYIRKTAQHHQLKTDASFRYERGTDPQITLYALKRAASLIKEIAGGSIASEVVDIYPQKVADFEVIVEYKHVSRLLGIDLKKERIFEILNSLNIQTEELNEEQFKAMVPPYRVDVTREADIIEEVLRIHGFNNIDLPSSFSSDYLAQFPKVDVDKIQQKTAEFLATKGFLEIITNSLTKPEYAANAENLEAKNSITILNKLSEDLGVMRQSLLYSGLEVAAHNINRRQSDLRLFEFGNTYTKEENDYNERKRLAIYLTGKVVAETWRIKPQNVDFYHITEAVRCILERFDMGKTSSSPIHTYPFEFGIQFNVKDRIIASLGKVKIAVAKGFGIKQEIFYADIDWDLLLKQTSNNIEYQEVSKYPEVRRDLSLVINKSVLYSEIQELALKSERQLLRSINVFDVYEGKEIGEEKKAYALSFTLQDNQRTLTDKVIDKAMSKMMRLFESELGAVIRQ
ncbi:MAG: phenylalanine--tRNA ligase subunit beta [Bacteroidota bacterium]